MLSETISRFLSNHIGQSAYFGFVVALLFGAPFVLVWLVFAPLIRNKEVGSRYGLVAGLTVAIWASLCELCVPYIGIYPNLPGAALALLVGARNPWVAEFFVHATNMVLWPALGWFAFRFRQKLRTGHG